MPKDKWVLNVFQSGKNRFFIIACDYGSGLVEAFEIDSAGCWHHKGGYEALDDVRLFYPVRQASLLPEIRASLRAYLTSDSFETRIDIAHKVCIASHSQEAHRCPSV